MSEGLDEKYIVDVATNIRKRVNIADQFPIPTKVFSVEDAKNEITKEQQRTPELSPTFLKESKEVTAGLRAHSLWGKLRSAVKSGKAPALDAEQNEQQNQPTKPKNK